MGVALFVSASIFPHFSPRSPAAELQYSTKLDTVRDRRKSFQLILLCFSEGMLARLAGDSSKELFQALEVLESELSEVSQVFDDAPAP